MAVGDVYNIVAAGHMDLQLVLNSFHYVRDGSSGEPDPAALWSDFLTKVIQPVRAIQTSAMIWESITIRDVDPLGIEVNLPISPVEHGNVSAESLPPFCAWSFLMTRLHRTTFNGHKRFAAIPETWQSEGVIDSGHDTAIAAVVTGLNATITDGTLDYLPCIYSTILNAEPRVPPVVNLLSTVQFKGISSQNTRKFGRGS